MNYSDANNYRRTQKYNITTEEIPANMVFKTYPGETYVFEDRDNDISYYCVTKALEAGNITELDKQAVCILAKFSAGCLTTKQLRELLVMIGAEFSEKMLDSSLRRLHRYQLVNFSRFKSPDHDKQANFRVLTLTQHGSRLAKALSVNHRYNGIALAAAMPHEVKARLATAQLVVQYLKHFPSVDEYQIRPVVVVDPDDHAIVRPAASLKIDDEWLNVEAPRRSDGYLENLIDKLDRYGLCFAHKKPVTILICAEDEDMAREINSAISKSNHDFDIYYTTDLALFGRNFSRSIFQFDSNSLKKRFKIAI